MSKAEERGEEEEEEEECFHDSLDRLLSSSNTSCSCSPSNSDSEEDPNANFNFGSSPDCNAVRTDPVPRFPRGLFHNYDVWISQPSSVEERRLRLLHRMGLIGDSSLLRHRASLSNSSRPGLFNRSISSDRLINPGETFSSIDNSKDNSTAPGNSDIVNDIDCDYDDSRVSGIVRSKSEGECNSSSEIHLINSTSSASPVNAGTGDIGIHVNYDHQCHRHSFPDDTTKSRNENGSPVTSGVSPSKPPKGKIIPDSLRNGSCSESLPIVVNVEPNKTVESTGAGDVNPVCMIKNLDNGKEFVVNELREDGMWKKIKEVDTGRQLTMEEFSEMCVGTSPIVQELMRRQNVEDGNKDALNANANGSGSKLKKRGGWLKSIKNVASSVTGYKERRSSDERDTSSEKGGRRSSSATDDSQDISFHGPERIRVRQYGKSIKELTALYKSQEIQAHNGSIWTIKFSLDGKYLASAGEDCVIHVWQVSETERKGDFFMDKLEDGNLNLLVLANGSPEPSSMSPKLDSHSERRRRGRSSISRKSLSFEQILVPDITFSLLEKPICSFLGHLDDVLNLSWSKSQQLLSSSMDKTVRLWDLSSKSCLKIFAHSDYVTCIQFNPVDDRYFISGSLDGKVRIWSIPDRQVVDWNDLHEMVTAACYTPDGQVYELMKKSFQLRQGGRPLAEYYNELNSIFMGLDYRRPNDMTCTTDIEKQRKRTAEDRVYMFLAGLDHSLDQVSSCVLVAAPLPSLEEAYSMVRREVQRQATMGAEIHYEVSALAVQKHHYRPAPSSTSTRFCTHCQATSHTVDDCWKLHGYPEWYKLKQAERKKKKSPENATIDTIPPPVVAAISTVTVSRATPSGGQSNQEEDWTW